MAGNAQVLDIAAYKTHTRLSLFYGLRSEIASC